MTDQELIREYAKNRSEQAFSMLVSRYADLVYSSCFRQVRNIHLAEETAQVVFMILAEKSESLADRISIAGWLVNTACYAGKNAAKYAERRKKREKETADMKEKNSSKIPEWEEFSKYLDEALHSLNEVDREVVVLRYFQNNTQKEIAGKIKKSEAAVQKQGIRAVEKLRIFMERKGIVLSAGVLSGLLVQNAVQAAPAGLVAMCMAAGTGAAAAGSSMYGIYKGALFMVIWTKAKIAGVAAAVAVCAGILTGFVSEHHARKEINEIQEQVAKKKDRIKDQQGDIERLQKELKENTVSSRSDKNEIEMLRSEIEISNKMLDEKEKALKKTLLAWALQEEKAENDNQGKKDPAADNNTRNETSLASFLSAFTDPRMRELSRTRDKLKMVQKYQQFLNESMLDELQVQQFLNEMIEYKYSTLPALINPAQENKLAKELIRLKKEHETRLKSILGQDGFNSLSNFEKDRKQENKRENIKEDIAEFNSLMKMRNRPLTQAQREDLTAALIEENSRRQESGFSEIIGFGLNESEKQEKFRKWAEYDNRLVNDCRMFLNSSQIGELEKFLTNRREMERIGSELILKSLFSPPGKGTEKQ